MHYGAYYYAVKFQDKTPPMQGETKKIILGGSLN